MSDVSVIAELGREAARAVIGEGAVDAIEVRPGLTYSEEPTYEFFYRINIERSPLTPGLTLIRLSQRLHEMLSDRGDENRPIVHLLNEADWQRFKHA